jgi:hypothetical protein
MDVCMLCVLCVVRSLCDELITRPEEPYQLWCVIVCDTETSRMRRPWSTGGWGWGSRQKQKKTNQLLRLYTVEWRMDMYKALAISHNDRGNPTLSVKTLSRCQSVQRKSPTNLSRIQHRPPPLEAREEVSEQRHDLPISNYSCFLFAQYVLLLLCYLS